jgi:hypothetical protein
MAKGVYTNRTSPNKRLTQEILYQWISEKFTSRTFPTTIIMLPGYFPQESVNLYHKYFYKPIIHAFESNSNIYNFLRDLKIVDSICRSGYDFRLHGRDVVEGWKNMSFEDLDFCTNFFSTRSRTFSHLYFQDTFSILRKRVGLMVTSTSDPCYYKAFMCTLSLRNGLGKQSTVACLASLINLTGYKLESIDGISFQLGSRYGKGRKIIGSGSKHPNGCTYYAYEHNIEVSQVDIYCKKNLETKMITYTDGTPMITFAMTFK